MSSGKRRLTVAPAPPVDTVELLPIDPFSPEIEETVRWINDKIDLSIHATCVEIGEYLLERFFDGDIERFRSHDPRKHASMRALKARCDAADIPLSLTTLFNYIGLAIQGRAMAAHRDVYARLGHTHKILLLPIRSPEIKAQLAEAAVAQGLTTRQFKAQVDRARREETQESARGRPIKNPILYTLEHLERALDARTIETEHYDELRRAGTYADALARVERLQTRVNALASALRRRKPRR